MGLVQKRRFYLLEDVALIVIKRLLERQRAEFRESRQVIFPQHRKTFTIQTGFSANSFHHNYLWWWISTKPTNRAILLTWHNSACMGWLRRHKQAYPVTIPAGICRCSAIDSSMWRNMKGWLQILRSCMIVFINALAPPLPCLPGRKMTTRRIVKKQVRIFHSKDVSVACRRRQELRLQKRID